MIETVQPVSFRETLRSLYEGLLVAPIVDVGEWQGQVGSSPRSRTAELTNVVFAFEIPMTADELQQATFANQPWAEQHFSERIGGVPHNPPPSNVNWPFRVNGHNEHLADGKFSHTYPERLWPKFANGAKGSLAGIRYTYGDLNDVVRLLKERPFTRQAFVPIWYPEDTGATSNQRVPCTLGYHFMMREVNGLKVLHVTYFMRSCDAYRHFKDDVYLASRLCQWVAKAVGAVPGQLVMHISSLHVFENDLPIVKTLRRRLYEG